MKHISDEMLQRWLDGVLGRAAKERAREHLSTCSSCRSRLDEWESLYEVLVAMPAKVPTDLFDNVMAAIATESMPARERAWVHVYGIGLAAAAMVAGVFLVGSAPEVPTWVGSSIGTLVSQSVSLIAAGVTLFRVAGTWLWLSAATLSVIGALMWIVIVRTAMVIAPRHSFALVGVRR